MLLEGINAYYGALRNTKLLGIARDNENIIKRQLVLEDERVQRGSGIAVDVLLAKARLQLAVERRIAVEGSLKEAIARYMQVFNHRQTIPTMVDPNVDLSFLPTEMKSAIDVAVSNNPQAASRNRSARGSGGM